MCRDVFTKHCGRPEISGKIGNFLVFSPLSDDAMTDIIIKFIREELDSYELELAHVDEYLMADFLKQRTKYGARGIRGLVNEAVGRHILRNRNLVGSNGKKISLSGSIENIEFKELEEGA
jgi:ATP-dependent Clp protease ATP-binding subunit ClpA